VVRRLAVTLVVLSAMPSLVTARAQGAFDLKAMLDTYARGDYDRAVQMAPADLGPLQLRFVQDGPAWINADPARADARRAAVAAFLLELAESRYESDGHRFLDLVEWMCIQLRAAGPPTEFERAWHAASHAIAGRSRSRTYLLGEFARLPHQKPSTAKPSDPQHPPARHLMHALERFPDDPQFQLSRIVAWTWGRDGEPNRNASQGVREALEGSRGNIRIAPQMEAIVALEPLLKIPATAAEANVRAGLVYFTVRDYPAALRAFEAAQAIATEPAMKYLAHFNAGRALEAASRTDSAMDEYRKALEIMPGAESATVALTSLEFARDEREAAIAQIDTVFNQRPRPTDPGRLIGYGSFVRWPQLKASLRLSLSALCAGGKC
jgi:tetratricopeptide (TPR) repeat protein